jgi:polyhydroxybutyrate depolymerase
LPAPLVFAFHGHGGSGASLERNYEIEQLWPAAVVVYPNGLTGHKGRTDPEGKKTGWQTAVGEDGDRDLAFYDVMLATLRSKLPVDPNRLYVVGHSNGSAFTSLLLNQRGTAIAATANSSSQPTASQLASDPVRSMFMSMGIHDRIVPYANQRKAIPIAEQKLGIVPSKTTTRGYFRMEHGRGNLELDTYVHPGGHPTPAGVPRLIVEFFRRHTLAAG